MGWSSSGIYLSTNSTISTADTLLTTDQVAAITGGGWGSPWHTLNLSTSGIAAGTYYLGVIADYNSAVSETDEANNASGGLQITITAQQPDLTASNVSASDATLDANQAITVNFQINNIGLGAAGGFDAGVYLSTDPTITTADTFINYQHFALLDGNSSVSGSISGMMPSGLVPGTTYWLGVIADDLNVITNEISESNNASAMTVTVNSPEIAVLGNGVNIADGDTTPSASDLTNFGSVAQGGAAVTRTFTVTNSGTGTLTTSGLTLPSGFTLVEGLSASIAAGASDTFTVQLNTATAGTFSGQISFTDNDSDENPFNFSISGTVTAPPDLTVSNVSVSDATPDANQTITVSFQANNIGSGPAGAAQEIIYLSNNNVFDASDTPLLYVGGSSFTGAGSHQESGQLSLSGWVAGGQTYYLFVAADGASQVTESNEANNVSAGVAIRIDSQTFNHPGGSHTTQYWDVLNQADWSNYFLRYDSLNRLTDQTINNDDGSHSDFAYDAASQNNWTDLRNDYDNQGRLTAATVHYDDGTRAVIGTDVANQYNWTDYRVDYDALGQLTGQSINYDDGSRALAGYDVANQYNWSDTLVIYDALARLTGQTIHYDDGSRTLVLYDLQNQNAWSDLSQTYDTQNALTAQTIHADDGTRADYLWDPENQAPWSSIVTHYDAQGTFVSQDGTYDNGTMWHI